MPNLTCRCCEGSLGVLLDLGAQPVCSHFQANPDSQAARHPLALAQCNRCGQLQIQDPAPLELLRSPHPWISYLEPEGHLDQVVNELLAWPGANPAWRIGSITYKDQSTIDRLSRLGWTDSWQLDLSSDLDITDGATDLATIQHQLTPERARRAAAKYGRADVLLVRHILEHTHAPAVFLTAVKELVKPDGLIVFECPDSQQAFLQREYTVIWEEHLWYFTPERFARFFSLFNLKLERLRVYPYAVENSLVAFISPQAVPTALPTATVLAHERAQLTRYAADFSRQKSAWKTWLHSMTISQIAAFGAGHSLTAFINFFDLADRIAFIADDHPKKGGLFLPGNARPIRPSTMLASGGIDYCLMGLSPESEVKVLTRQTAAQEAGVRFVSIFPTSTHATPIWTNRKTEQDVFPLAPELPTLDDTAPQQLRAAVRQTSRLRSRYNAHTSSEAAIHEMLICLHTDGYVRPHRHLGKSESIQVVEGFADLILFNDDGHINRVIPLGPYGSGRTWYVRLPDPLYHTLVLRDEDFIFLETTSGPFDRAATDMAPWAPDEQDSAAISAYKTHLLSEALTRTAHTISS